MGKVGVAMQIDAEALAALLAGVERKSAEKQRGIH